MPKWWRQQRLSSPVLKIWRDMPELVKVKDTIPRMPVMRGDPRSRICIIAPGCNPDDYEAGTPLSHPAALVLHELFAEIGVDTQKCCVMSCSRYGLKPNKKSTDDIREALTKMIRLNQFDLIITVGDDAFKFIFGRARKPAPSIFGHIMYLAETGHKPLFALPELLGLHVEVPSDPRTRRKILDWQDKTLTRFRKLLAVLEPLIKKL